MVVILKNVYFKDRTEEVLIFVGEDNGYILGPIIHSQWDNILSQK